MRRYIAVALTVQEHFVAGASVFHVRFPGNRPPLILTRVGTDAKIHWSTSIPGGRQLEAGEIGPLIEAFIKP